MKDNRLEEMPQGAMFTVALATFLIITAEMLPAGVLPLIAADLGVTKSFAGYLMTGYAFTVVVTCVPLTALTRAIDRTRLLRGVIAMYIVGALLTAAAPTYWLVMAARIFTGIAHGLFWSIISAYPAYLVVPRLIPRAVTFTAVGSSVAYVAGVPLATYLGQLLGWRVSQALIAGGLVILLALMFKTLPLVGASRAKGQSTKTTADPSELVPAGAPKPALRLTSVASSVALCVIVAIYVIGHYTGYSYISVIVTTHLGIDVKFLSLVLAGAGAAGFAASALSGRTYERFGYKSLVAFAFVVAASLTALSMVAGISWLGIIIILIWSAGGAFVPSFFMMRLLTVAPERIRDVVGAAYNASFNLGIGGGALLGGLLLSGSGIGAAIGTGAALVWVAAALALGVGAVISRTERFVAASPSAT